MNYTISQAAKLYKVIKDLNDKGYEVDFTDKNEFLAIKRPKKPLKNVMIKGLKADYSKEFYFVFNDAIYEKSTIKLVDFIKD